MIYGSIVRDAKTALNGLVPEGIIIGKPQTDFEMRVDDMLNCFAESPRKATGKALGAIVMHKDSQVRDKPTYLAHCISVGRIFSSAVRFLQDKYDENLYLPHPDDARGCGVIHDLNPTFSNWERGRHYSKELDLWIIANVRGMETLANHVAMHSDYFGIARLMVEDKPFPLKEAYAGMIKVFRGNGPLSYRSMMYEFSKFLEGKSNLHLLVLNAIDHIDVGQPKFNPHTIDSDFEARFTKGAFLKYTSADSLENMSPLGQAFLSGGRERIRRDVDILKDLALGDTQEMRERYADTGFFRK